MKKKKAVFIITFLVLLFIFYGWYYTPNNIKKTINICTLDGKQATAVFDVRWQRYFFKPTELRGTITINGSTYICIKDTNISFASDNFIGRLKSKINSEKFIPPFIREIDKSKYNMNDCIFLSLSGIKLDIICLSISQEKSNLITYYGPAITRENAEALSKTLFTN